MTNLVNNIIEWLKNVYDPEFPMIDIYTLWLIYDIVIKWNTVKIIMTLTTPMCPMADMLQSMVKESAKQSINDEKFDININLTFEPIWSIDMIKDDDFKKMFL